MDFELKAAKAKWEREQKQRKEEAKAKLQQEKKAREEAARLKEALEAAQIERRLQEARAVEAAKLQEERDLFAGDGIGFNTVLQASQVAGDGDKVKLPPSAFEHLSSQGALEKGPMLFEIAVITESPATMASDEMPDIIDTKNTHCGVLEFTAPEGYAELPPHVWSNAGIGDIASNKSPYVRIRYVRLPKCTYAKLVSENSDFADVPNHRAVLETKLRQHATLSIADILIVQHDGVDYTLRVSDLKPSASVSVLETDMEVDVVQPVSAPGTASQSRLLPLEIGKPQSGVVEEGSYIYYKFGIDQKLLEAANKGDANLDVHLDVDGDGTVSDADLYVSAHPVLFPSQHQHHWASHDMGSKVIHLNGGGRTLSTSLFSVAVYGYRNKAAYRVSVRRSQPAGPATGQKVGLALRNVEGDASIEQGLEICGNCRQAIPSRTIALHEAYCRRHNVVCTHPGCGVVLRQEEFKKHVHCSKCGQSLQKEELEKHLRVYHEPQLCRCGAMLERDDMVKHQAESCPLRSIVCRFCGDIVQAGKEAENLRDRLHGLTQHESECGSRTSPCEVCARAVMLKEMDLHRAAAHESVAQTVNVDAHVNANTIRDIPPAFPLEQTKVVSCPICNAVFSGSGADTQLNGHLDDEHFAPTSRPAEPVEEVHDNEAINAALSSSFRRSLSVSCPICGLAVHSERDLSAHIDMVH